jgi:hypothetical protein
MWYPHGHDMDMDIGSKTTISCDQFGVGAGGPWIIAHNMMGGHPWEITYPGDLP